jgi:hypothetical protein
MNNKDITTTGKTSWDQKGISKKHPIFSEFLHDQVPLILLIFTAGLVISYWQNGFLPGGDRPFPIAKVKASIFHLVFMGSWTGYVMGLVGNASGIFSMPYSMSIIGFENVALSPTSLITTFLNPFGALLGYYREKQWNLDFAKWFCIGAFLGAPIGSFIRVYWLQDPGPFKIVIGIVLFFMGIYLWLQITPFYLRRSKHQKNFDKKFYNQKKKTNGATGLPLDFAIVTLEKSWTKLRIGFWEEEQSFSVPLMLFIGFSVGVVASALGVGGGFLLVPIIVTCFNVPMYVLVAATVPFVITLSISGLIAYTCITPLLTGITTSPDWSFGLFVASGALFGAWAASKTQKFIPEKILKPFLGSLSGVVGLLYILNYF